MTTFSELKNNQKESFKKLTEKLQALANPTFGNDDDDTFWKPTLDKAGNGYAVIRLLPAPPGEEDAIVRIYSHAFQGPNGWYIENSLTTLGKADPCGEMNTRLWNAGEEGRKFVQHGDPVNKKPASKRKLRLISNVYIVNDSGNHDNDGKVFRWRYGSKIYDKIFNASNPKFPDAVAFDPFNLWTGANLKLKIKKGDGGWPNYDDSRFDLVEDGNVERPRGALFDDDDKLEKIWRSCYSLQDLIAPSKFKSYNELKERLVKIMGDKNIISESRQAEEIAAPTGRTRDTTPPWKPTTTNESVGVEDDEMAFFKSLASGDDEAPF